MKTIMLFFAIQLSCIALGGESVSIKSVEAQQRYPWNGLVDIAVTVEGSEDDIVELQWSFVATNNATGTAVSVASVSQNGSDTGSGTTWTRRFIWNATNDVGEVRIDDLALTACAKVMGGVQLWGNGPYWAECNVGATKPEEYGYYFWWGDTVGYKRSVNNDGWVSIEDGEEFIFNTGNCPTYSRSGSQLRSDGYIDATGNLVAAHDAATAHLGSAWRMPTDLELSALINNCTATWITTNGVQGRLVTGKGAYATKSIFLPAAGYGTGANLLDVGSFGYDWSSTPYAGNYSYASRLYFYSNGFRLNGSYYYRYLGHTVRPVREFAQSTVVDAVVYTHLKLDSRAGTRECSADGEQLCYDVGWYDGAETVSIIENGKVIGSGTKGCLPWKPSICGSYKLQLKVLADDGSEVGLESAEFVSNHVEVVTTGARSATCTDPGCTKGSHCSRCNAILSASETIPALGHVEVVTTEARSATCTDPGCTKGSYCSRCKDTLSASETIPALGHVEFVTTEARPATSTDPGCTQGSYCSRCNAILSVSETIPALGYIRNVNVRQLWPHNKVALEFTVAEDIGEVTGVDEKLFAWCARGDVTNLSSRILGDHSARPGVHRIVWDMEADGLRFVNAETAFGVVFLGGVQLWENGPYWAECNVGASQPEEYGYYFWWGDTVGYSSSSFGSGNGSTYNKNYSQLLSDGYIDSTGNLVAAHDAATAHLGAPWRMPTDAELSSLINNCVTEWTVRNGVHGLLITGKGAFASKSIFLPAAGYGYGRELLGAGTLGDYWSSTPSPDVSHSWGLSRGLGINSSNFNWDSYRYYLQSVRPLRGFIK